MKPENAKATALNIINAELDADTKAYVIHRLVDYILALSENSQPIDLANLEKFATGAVREFPLRASRILAVYGARIYVQPKPPKGLAVMVDNTPVAHFLTKKEAAKVSTCIRYWLNVISQKGVAN